MATCGMCYGSGRCPQCGGDSIQKECSMCNGARVCPRCDGTGAVNQMRTWRIGSFVPDSAEPLLGTSTARKPVSRQL
jgi:hypothetical protein